MAYPGCRVVWPSRALPPGRAWFCVTCGVTPICRHSFTKSRVSNPLSPPTVTAFVPGTCSSITRAASALGPCRSPETLPRPRSARCDSPPTDSRCNSISTPSPRPCAPAAPRDRSSTRASRSTAARRESYRGIAGIVRRRRWLFVLGLKAFRARPSLQQRTVDGEMLVAGQTLGPRLLHHPRQKLLGHVGFQQAVAILGEHGRVPHLIIGVQVSV